MKMKIDKKNRQIDQANMNDLVQTFQKRNEEALKKKSRIEIGASLIETCPDFIPSSIKELASRHKKFVKAAKSSGLPSLGIREFKNSLAFCIKNLISLACPEIVNDSDFNLAPSLTTTECDTKLAKILILYNFSLPAIRQNIVYA